MKKVIAVQFARKRKRRTDYRARLVLLKSGRTRFVVRRSAWYIRAQLVEYADAGDRVSVSASSSELKKLGWALSGKNIPAAYLTGFLLGSRALKAGINSAILDAGTSKPVAQGRTYAALKGAIDAGLTVPAAEDIFPSADRIAGKHISAYIKSAAGNQFAAYKKASADVESQIRTVREKIAGDMK
jgi:large subunit ribosomal protein L18